MRVGKTPTCIRSNDLIRARRILWLTTGAARIGHAYAWDKYSPLDHDCRVIDSGKDAIPDSGVVITSYDLAAGPLYDRLMRMEWDALDLDEAHKLKNATTKRAKAVLGERTDAKDGLASRAAAVKLLSGTPSPNHPGELWPVLHAFFPSTIHKAGTATPMRQFEFETRFCKTAWSPFGQSNRKIVGGKNLPELKKRIQPFFLRRRFADVYKDAAGVEIDLLFVDAQDNLDALREVERDEVAQQYKRALAAAVSDVHMKAIEAEIADTVAKRLRRLTGVAKVPGVVAWAREFLEDRKGAKVVLFGHHTEVLDGLVAGLAKYKPLRVSGGVTAKAKGEAEHLFRSDPKRRVFVGNLISAGEAIDLSVADDIVLVESSWVPGENEQALRRIVNMAKQRENIAWFATLAGSIDERVQQTNARKTRDIMQLFG